jgi:gamma-glutamyl hercynylcysteine S-oxide synthase
MDLSSPGYSAAEALRCGGPAAVREALAATRARTLALADAYARALEGSAMHVPYRATLNPPLWEWGHVGWFQEYWIGRNRQRPSGTACDPDHERAPSLLRGADALYDSGRVEHPSRWQLALPSPAATREYLAATLEQTLELLDRLPHDAGDDDLYFFRLAVLHEQMHAEAAMYMARELGLPVPAPKPVPPSSGVEISGADAVLRVPAQIFTFGSPIGGFAFDNELGAHPVRLDAFEIDAQPVSWARFSPFVEAGGYRRREWWSDPGWAWLQAAAPEPPVAGSDGPAIHLNAHEADAWCRWAGRRLPIEAEWECAALTVPGFAWGRVWEWTASPFLPYPGFEPHPYRDYSAPWFGRRRVLRGACHATSPSLAHPRYRNFFEPHRRDVFAGFRSCA